MIDDLSALRLQLEWGADEAISETALDRFGPAAALASMRRPAPALTTVPRSQTIDELMAEWAAFEGCGLRTTAMQLVRPDGNPQAKLMFIGDAPGSDDDRSGRAFSGATGATLDRVLATVGVDRRQALLTTLVPWRPPGNRRLTETEITLCMPFIHRLLGIVRPGHLVLLGSQAVRSLTGHDTPIRRLRGRWLEVKVQNEQLTIAALALPTPDQWLTNASAKQQLWSDLVELRAAVTTA